MPTEEKLATLEIRLSDAEDQIDALNRTVYRQQQHIDALREALQALRQQMGHTPPPATPTLRDEIPPHY